MSDIAYIGPQDFTEETLVEYLKGIAPPVIALDTETISLKDRTLIGVGLALNPREAVYFPVLPDRSKYLYLAWRLMATPGVKVFCNALYDLYALTEYRADSDMERGSEQQIIELDGWKGAKVQEARLPAWLGHGKLACISAMAHIQALPSGALAEMARAYIGMVIDTIPDILPAEGYQD